MREGSGREARKPTNAANGSRIHPAWLSISCGNCNRPDSDSGERQQADAHRAAADGIEQQNPAEKRMRANRGHDQVLGCCIGAPPRGRCAD